MTRIFGRVILAVAGVAEIVISLLLIIPTAWLWCGFWVALICYLAGFA